MKFFIILVAGFSSLIFLTFSCFRSTKSGFFSLMMLIPVLYQSRRAAYLITGPFIITPVTVSLLVIGAFLICNSISYKAKKSELYFLGFILYTFTLCLIHHENSLWAIRGWQLIVLEPSLAFFICIKCIENRNEAIRAVHFSLFLVLSFIFIEILISGGVSISSMAKRQANLGSGGFTGGYEEPAVLSNFLLLTLPFLIIQIEKSIKAYSILKILLALLVISLIILSFTRATIAFLGINFIIIISFLKLSVKNKFLISIILMLVFFASLAVFEKREKLSDSYSNKRTISVMGFDANLAGGTLQRYFSYKDSIELAFEPKTILIGRGALSEKTFWSNLDPIVKNNLQPISSVGNGILTIIIYFGLPVLLFLLYYFFKHINIILTSSFKKTGNRIIALVPLNIFLFILTAQGGLVAYGFTSHFPGWGDPVFASGLTEGLQFLPTNMNTVVMSIFLALSLKAMEYNKHEDHL